MEQERFNYLIENQSKWAKEYKEQKEEEHNEEIKKYRKYRKDYPERIEASLYRYRNRIRVKAKSI